MSTLEQQQSKTIKTFCMQIPLGRETNFDKT